MQQGRAVKGTVVATLLALMVAACGGSAAPDVAGSQAATQPPVTPNAPTVTPTPVDTPTPTSSPEPAPTPTLLPIASLFKASMAKPSASKVRSAIKSVLAQYPGATDTSGESKWVLQTYLDTWKHCQSGDPTLKGDPDTNKALYCEALIRRTWDNYSTFKDLEFYNLAGMVYAYANATLPKPYVAGIRDGLSH